MRPNVKSDGTFYRSAILADGGAGDAAIFMTESRSQPCSAVWLRPAHRRRLNIESQSRQGPLLIIVYLLIRDGLDVIRGMEEDPAAIRARGTVLMIRVDADDW